MCIQLCGLRPVDGLVGIITERGTDFDTKLQLWLKVWVSLRWFSHFRCGHLILKSGNGPYSWKLLYHCDTAMAASCSLPIHPFLSQQYASVAGLKRRSHLCFINIIMILFHLIWVQEFSPRQQTTRKVQTAGHLTSCWAHPASLWSHYSYIH